MMVVEHFEIENARRLDLDGSASSADSARGKMSHAENAEVGACGAGAGPWLRTVSAPSAVSA